MKLKYITLLVLILFTAAGFAGSCTCSESDINGPITQSEIEKARQIYSADVTRALLQGTVTAPEGFDELLVQFLGQDRLNALRSGSQLDTGDDNDIAAVCLMRLDISLAVASGMGQVEVEYIDSDYAIAAGNTSGSFLTGQNADIMLSGVDFNNTGGSLLFNHQSGIATDGTHLIVADTYNNRVLIWNALPTSNTAPDIVLGQENFITNDPGTGLDEMNWPVSVSTDGTRLVVTDTENDRILIWTAFPMASGQAADLYIDGGSDNTNVSKTSFHWPWGIWTDGNKMAVTSTQGGGILIWNTFPASNNQDADILLTGGGDLGTPRHITSDGNCLIVGDHNAKVDGRPEKGTFFWKAFPTTDDQAYDFFMTDPVAGESMVGPWLRGDFTGDGKLLLAGETLHIWNTFPENQLDEPDLSIDDYNFGPGDWVGVAVADSMVYISSGNNNRIVVYNSIPTSSGQLPDFAIGSPDIDTNTLETHFVISNPVVASDGNSLFVTSDFDKKMYVWKNLPDESGAYPDIVYSLQEGPLDNALWGDTLAMAGKSNAVYIWKELPLDGQQPDVVFYRSIGDVEFNEIYGVALDDKYLYLADYSANKIYIWEGIPSWDDNPKYTLNVDGPWRLSSDGNYLTVAQMYKQSFLVYDVDKLSDNAVPATIGDYSEYNGVQAAAVYEDHLFVIDSGNNRVLVWNDVENALAGADPDAILGTNSNRPEIGQNKLYWPASLCFDGNYLWVGEFKFSERILRYSPS